MNKRVYISLACALALNANAADLGTISVESSTIDDKFESKKTEVSNTTTISGKNVESYHAENIANVLNNIPGVTVRINEGDSNKIHIRGIAGEMYMGEKPGVAIVIDGVPVQERAGSVNIDSDNIESIKVIKGGASYLYGNDALAGAVIITTKRPKAKTGGEISAERGSFGYEKYIGRFNGATENFAVNLQSTYKESDGYWQDSDYWTKGFIGKFQYYVDDTSDITLGIDRTKRYENDSGSITAVDNAGVNQISTNPKSIGEVGYSTNYDIDLDKYFLTYSKDFENNSNLMAQIYQYEDTTTNDSSPYDTDGDGLNDDHKLSSYANTLQKGLKSEYRIDGTNIASMIGIDLARNEEEKNSKYRVNYTGGWPAVFHPVGEITRDTSFDEDINALYGELKYQITDKLTTSINARYDEMKYDYFNNLTNKKWDNKFTEYSYKVGATYKLKENSIIYTNTSTGFRVPLISQLYAGDMGGGWGSTYANNLNIETEKTYNYELGYRGKTNLISYDIAMYQLDRKDVIGSSNGNYASADTGVVTIYDNIADVQNRGLELSLETDTTKNLFFKLNYTYLNSKYKKYDTYNLSLNEAGVDLNGNFRTNDDYVAGTYNLSGNYVPRTSKHTINFETNYRIISPILLTAELNYRSSQFADELNRIKVEGYSIVNLRGTYDVKLAGFDTQLFLKIDNLFDKQYYMMPRVTGDRNDDGVYNSGDMGLTVNPGRVYSWIISLKF